jgi:hypothetical protein
MYGPRRFISHARKDKNVAVAICEKLESAGVGCWIAGRDMSAGEDWTEATWNAIGASRVMVLLLSENANSAIQRLIFKRNRTCVLYQAHHLPLRFTKSPMAVQPGGVASTVQVFPAIRPFYDFIVWRRVRRARFS